jgi:hypothetical protein
VLQTASQRRTFGWVLLIGGSVGLVVCLVGGIVGFIALGSARRASVKGLDVTQEALVSVRGTLELADDLVGSVQDGLLVVEDTLGEVASTVATADDVLAQVDAVAGALPGSVDAARSTLRSLGSVAAVIDQTLTAASQVPFVPDYRPPRPLAEVIGQLDADLAPIQEALTGLDQNLGGLTSAGTGLTTGLDQLTARMADINRELAGANELVDQYLATAERAAAVVTDARNDLDRDLTALRWLMLPAGLALALAQLVPIWLGGGLLGKWPAPVVAKVPAEIVRPDHHHEPPAVAP